jgi:nicotinamide riboside transporter PnuC
MFTILGLFASTAGCLCIYLAAGNQRWLGVPWPRHLAWPAGGCCFVLGWFGLAQEASSLTATFIFATALMLIFSILPYIGTLLHVRRTR